MKNLTGHVLDIELGKPASGVAVELEFSSGDHKGPWKTVALAVTNQNGRITDWNTKENLTAGVYRINFLLQDYFKKQNRQSFYPMAQIIFNVTKPQEHHHIPLLLSGYGMSTYRGS